MPEGINDSGVVGASAVVLDAEVDLYGERAGSRNCPGATAADEVDPDIIEDADE